jgi:hypothetical protein
MTIIAVISVCLFEKYPPATLRAAHPAPGKERTSGLLHRYALRNDGKGRDFLQQFALPATAFALCGRFARVSARCAAVQHAARLTGGMIHRESPPPPPHRICGVRYLWGIAKHSGRIIFVQFFCDFLVISFTLIE